MSTLPEIRAAIEKLLAQPRGWWPSEDMLIAGNHLANFLLQFEDPSKYRNSPYWDVAETQGVDYADVWTGWKAIMDARDNGVPELYTERELRTLLALVEACEKCPCCRGEQQYEVDWTGGEYECECTDCRSMRCILAGAAPGLLEAAAKP